MGLLNLLLGHVSRSAVIEMVRRGGVVFSCREKHLGKEIQEGCFGVSFTALSAQWRGLAPCGFAVKLLCIFLSDKRHVKMCEKHLFSEVKWVNNARR